MSTHPGVDASHPHFVFIPDSKTEGQRFYREPAEPNPLQITFLEAEGEHSWIEEMRGLLSDGRTAEADARLVSDLAGFDGRLARLCKSSPASEVMLEGWEDLLPILAEWEGPSISAITLGLTNPPDLVFEPGQTHDPDLLLGLYSNEAFPFSDTSNADLLAECAKDLPDWVGSEEDVEFYCSLSGLAELNTALISWKHRRFLRDGRDGVEGRAPGGYVEYVLASWFLATRFLQAAERAIAEHGLPEGSRLIAGTVEVNADFVAVLGAGGPSVPFKPTAAPIEPTTFATLTVKPWGPREDPTVDALVAGQTLRQRIIPVEPQDPAEKPFRSFFGRLMSRFRGN